MNGDVFVCDSGHLPDWQTEYQESDKILHSLFVGFH